VIYMEGITDARRFLSALRGTANTKPVVIIKSGNGAAARARPPPTRAP
jgi:acetyltransferase